MKNKEYGVLIALTAVFGGLAGCGSEKEVQELPPRPVYTLEVPEPTSTVDRFFSGQLDTSASVSLAFEVSGRVMRVLARRGQEYMEGDVLAMLDPSDYQNSLDDAQATLTIASQELRRIQRLFESGNASQSQLDEAIASERSARANFNLATKSLEDTTLRMPYRGVIASVPIDAQQVLNVGQTAITVQGEGPMEFEFGVPTSVVGLLSTGMSLSVQVGDLDGATYPATITKISPDIENNTTYGVTAYMDVVEPAFRAGMDGEAKIELPKRGGASIEIPLSCVLADADANHYVWIAEAEEEDKVRIVKRPVEISSLAKDGLVSVLSGLEPGDRVVTRGVHRVDEGTIARLIASTD
ncbi:MAG: efflux RND transporter periplasmic adaptor subunit [Verrucomicrobiota bacterium]